MELKPAVDAVSCAAIVVDSAHTASRKGCTAGAAPCAVTMRLEGVRRMNGRLGVQLSVVSDVVEQLHGSPLGA
jgi:hypothetical protein